MEGLGSFFAKFISSDADLLVHDINPQSRRIKALGATPASLEEIATCKIILLMVPISELSKTCKKLAPHLGKENLVVDVCSVKEKPVQTMLDTLPKDCQILGTHPMFGTRFSSSHSFWKQNRSHSCAYRRSPLSRDIELPALTRLQKSSRQLQKNMIDRFQDHFFSPILSTLHS